MNTLGVCLFLVFVQVIFCGTVPEISEEDITKACITELKLDDATIKTLDALQDYDENNPNCGKLLSCTWKKMGLQDASGNVNFDKLKKYLADYTQKRVAAGLSKNAATEATVGEWLQNCQSLQGSDDGQTALKVHFCLAKGIQKFVKA